MFEAFFRDYYPPLVRFAERLVLDLAVAEDIVQNLFVHLWEQADTLTPLDSLKSYLFRAVRNRCLNHLRSLAIRDKHQLLYLEALVATEVETGDSQTALAQEIRAALAKLPPQMAAVFVMKYQEGKKRHEIACQLGISENTVKTQLSRGRAKMRKLLQSSIQLNFFW